MNKIVSCILCFLPLVLYVAVLIPFLNLYIMMEFGYDVSLSSMVELTFWGAIMALVRFAVLVWLFIKTYKHPTLNTTAKVIWVAVLYIFNVIAYPIYWFVNIRKE